jgi:hypothetical protein
LTRGTITGINCLANVMVSIISPIMITSVITTAVDGLNDWSSITEIIGVMVTIFTTGMILVDTAQHLVEGYRRLHPAPRQTKPWF